MRWHNNGVEYWDAEEIARKYGYTEYHIRRLARQYAAGENGGLPGIKKGRQWWFNPAVAERVLVNRISEKADDGGRKAGGERQQDRYACIADL